MDHLHPDWAIALAASANGKDKLQEFNHRFGRRIAWVPWQRPGFELALLIEKAVRENPGVDGLLLGSHGLFTWGRSQRECYLNSIRTIDQMGEFIMDHQSKKGALFGGLEHAPHPGRRDAAAQILPALRGVMSSNRRVVAHYADDDDALTFAGSKWSKELGSLGTSCPDHFLRTRICPLFIDWNPAKANLDALKARIQEQAEQYRVEYKKYYDAWATPDSPKLRDSNPSVVIIPGLGLFGFGKNKKEARITTEFFINAIHVMAGAIALEDGEVKHPLPQARRPEQSAQFKCFHNYVALPRSEAFRIEYWALEEAKLQRMPPEAEFSRKIVLVVGGGSGIGREVALLLARKGAHVAIADIHAESAKGTAAEAAAIASADFAASTAVDLGSSTSLAEAAKFTILQTGTSPSFTNAAAINIGSGDSVAVSGGAFAYTAGSIAGPGTITFSSGSLTLTQSLSTATVPFSLTTETVGGTGTLTVDPGTALLVKSSTINAPVANQGLFDGAESLDSGTGHRPWSDGARQWDCARHRRGGFDNVPARPGDPFAREVQDRVLGIGINRRTS